MANKTILITGATDGIGKATAKALAKQGHTIIIHGRNIAKAQAVCNEIKTETGNNNIDILISDMVLLDEVKRMADEVKQKYDRLDVLINNAGTMFGRQRETTKDGLEKTMVVNLFAPILLTELLLDVLAKSHSARIVNVTSKSSMSLKPDLSDFHSEKKYNNLRTYGLSKLYKTWATLHLATELRNKGIENICVNLVHPGAIASSPSVLAGDYGFFTNMFVRLLFPLMPKAEKGAETSIYLATSPEVENVTGKYFIKKKIANDNNKFHSPENEKIVWDYCMQIVKPYL